MKKSEKSAKKHYLLGRTGILAALFGCTAAVILGGCAGKEKAPVDTTVHLGVMYSSDIVPLTIITEQGLDKKYGVQLDMQVFLFCKGPGCCSSGRGIRWGVYGLHRPVYVSECGTGRKSNRMH